MPPDPKDLDPRAQSSRKKYHRLTVAPTRAPPSSSPIAPHRSTRGFLRRRQARSEIAAQPRLLRTSRPPSRHQPTTPSGTLCPTSADRPAGTAGDMGSSDACRRTTKGCSLPEGTNVFDLLHHALRNIECGVTGGWRRSAHGGKELLTCSACRVLVLKS